MMQDLGLGYRAVSYEQLAQGRLDELPAKVLVLPHRIAMSSAECEAVSRFVESGGTVIADLQPAVMSGHCRILAKPGLDDLFGVSRQTVDIRMGDWKVYPTTGGDGATTVAAGAMEPGLRAGEGQANWVGNLDGDAAEGMFHRQVGGGHAWYMGFDGFAAYTQLRARAHEAEPRRAMLLLQNTVLGMLESAGVSPRVSVRDRDPQAGTVGDRTPWVWPFLKDAGTNAFVTVIRDYFAMGVPFEDRAVRVEFDRQAWVYDVLDGVEIGFTDGVDMTLLDNTVRVYALMPYRVAGLEIKPAARAVRAGGDLDLNAGVTVSGGEPAMHWFQVTIRRPDGVAVEAYSSTVAAAGGKTAIRIPLAMNDPAGQWQATVTDIATGTSRTVSFDVQP
jgi:hypothetical protein